MTLGRVPRSTPDQSGQNLAWSLGTIQGYDRASVSLTVNLPSLESRLQLDTGAAGVCHARRRRRVGHHARRDAPAGQRLRSQPARLDARRQHERPVHPGSRRRQLDYNPTHIFNFLHTQIGYNSYLGLGPRGAGDALVERRQCARRRQPGRGPDARLGHPGAVCPGDALADPGAAADLCDVSAQLPDRSARSPPARRRPIPASDPTLLAETEAALLVPVQHRQRHAGRRPAHARRDDRPDVHDVDRHLHRRARRPRRDDRVPVRSPRSTARPARCSGSGSTTTTVLDQTFDDVDLVGRPLTIGNFVTSPGSRRLDLHRHDEHLYALHRARRRSLPRPEPGRADRTARPYQEVLTNFPLGSQVLTGLFLNVTLERPAGPAPSLTRRRSWTGSASPRAGRRQHRPAGGQPNRPADPHQQRPLDDQRAARPAIADRDRRRADRPQQSRRAS